MSVRWSLCLLLLALVSRCSVSGHAMHKRADYDGNFMGDEANDDWAQNDDGGNDGDGEDSDVAGTIVTEPKVYKVKLGDNVTMECKVTPNEGPVVQWTQNKADVLFIGSVKARQVARYQLDDTSRSLSIENIQAGDEGEYTCEVMVKTDGSKVTHRLVVLSAPRITRLSATNNGKVVEDTALELRCDVTGSPPPQIIWSRQKDAGSPNERLLEGDAVFHLNSAIIKHAKPEHSGNYYCYAFNKEGNAQSEVAVTVLRKPHAMLHSEVVNTAPGERALLQCSAHGDPAPTITWYKDSSPIIADDRRYFITFDGPHSNLTVVPTQETDFGRYTCVAQNYHNRHNKSAELVQRPVVGAVAAEGRALRWTLHSHLPLQQIQLQLIDEKGVLTKVDVPLPEDLDRSSYELKYRLPQDLAPGKYQAVISAKNTKDWGSSEEPVIIEIDDHPMYIQRSSVYRDSAHSIRLSSSCFLSTTIIYLLVRML